MILRVRDQLINVINDLAESELADLLFKYGEEPKSRQIARAIVKARPIKGTDHLARVISSVSPKRRRIHPATRSFQAIRIAVNDELKSIELVLPQAIECINSWWKASRNIFSFFGGSHRQVLFPARKQGLYLFEEDFLCAAAGTRHRCERSTVILSWPVKMKFEVIQEREAQN